MTRFSEVGSDIFRGAFCIVGKPCQCYQAKARKNGNIKALATGRGSIPGIVESDIHLQEFGLNDAITDQVNASGLGSQIKTAIFCHTKCSNVEICFCEQC